MFHVGLTIQFQLNEYIFIHFVRTQSHHSASIQWRLLLKIEIQMQWKFHKNIFFFQKIESASIFSVRPNI